MQLKGTILLCLSLTFFPLVSHGQVYYDDEGYEYTDDQGNYYNDNDNNYDNDNRYQQADEAFTKYYRNDRDDQDDQDYQGYQADDEDRSARSSPFPRQIKSPSEKFIIVDPREHAWGAYNQKGILERWGLATSGANWCGDIDKPCRTKTGSFRIYSLGDEDCYSKKFPVPDGGAPMPYCMYFNGGQALHGSDEVVYGNESHGCVRLHVSDARWLRYHFVDGPNVSNHFHGTLVVIRPY